MLTKENQREEEDSSICLYQIKEKENNIIENNDNHIYINNFQKTYTCQDIIAILNRIGCPPDIISLIKPEHLRKEDIYNTKYFCIKKPRQRRNKKIKSKEKNKNKNKQGRKLKSGNEQGKHNKFSHDNIIKKIKRIFLSNAIKYVNELLLKYKQTFKCSDKLKKLNYKLYINKLNKQFDSDMLNKLLKCIVSEKIDGKNRNKLGDNHNEKIINKISVKLDKDNELYLLLNMTFSEWIDFFLFKSINKSNDDIMSNLLLSELENQIGEDNEKEIYFTIFVYYLYNYQNYVKFKKGRNSKKNNSLEKKDILEE